MAFNQDLLKEIMFFINAKDEEVLTYKLEKLGIEPTQLRIKTFPPSSIRNALVSDIGDENHIKCINCDHWKLSHEEQKISETSSYSTCFGLTSNQNCNCKKFISVSGGE